MKQLNWLFFLIATGVILILNLYPMLYLSSHSPAGRTYALIHNNVQDFYLYQSLMNEGATGSFLIYDPFTTENHRTSVIFSFFTILGKISRNAGLPFVFTYHIARVLGAVLFLYAAYLLLKRLKLSHTNLAYLFLLFATPLFTSKNINGAAVKIPFMYWWTGMDAVRRAIYLPHHMFGAFFLVVSVLLIIGFVKTAGKQKMLWLTILAVFMAYIHTPSLFILLIVLPPSVIIYLLSNKIDQRSVLKFIPLAIYWLIGLLALILMVSQSNQGFPWSVYLEWEKTLQYPLREELLGGLGFLLPFALIGLPSALFSGNFAKILIACWFSIPLLLIPFAPFLNISNIRLIQGLPYLTMAVLAAIGLETLTAFILRMIAVVKNKPYESVQSKLKQKVILIVYPLVLTAFFLVNIPVIVWSLKDQIREYSPVFGNVYLDDRLKNAFAFINNNYPAKTIVLSTFYTGNYLPVYTHTLSFIGHTSYTANVSLKEKAVMKFFENKMTWEEAAKFLKDNKIKLVFQGPEEKPLYNGLLYPNHLKPVFMEDVASIYEVK